ncbi:MAG TPA: class I SAM-dependent methyltransferase, partial [Caulobacteraceae bacterium]
MNLIYALQDAENPNSLSSRFRRARARRVVELIEAAFSERGEVRVIDLGGEPDYWLRVFDRDLLEGCRVRITLVNPQAFEVRDPLFTAAVGDACALP